MILLRRADLILQAVLMVLCLIIWAASPIMAAAGFFLLGLWQVISAALNTYPMTQGPFRKRIFIYWMLTAAVLIALAIFGSVHMETPLIVSGGIAIYYWIIYRAFQSYLTHRKELSTIVR